VVLPALFNPRVLTLMPPLMRVHSDCCCVPDEIDLSVRQYIVKSMHSGDQDQDFKMAQLVVRNYCRGACRCSGGRRR
jgi:hypothetical protein